MPNFKLDLTKVSIFFLLLVIVESVATLLSSLAWEFSMNVIVGPHTDFGFSSYIPIVYVIVLGIAWLIGAFIPPLGKKVVALQKSVIITSIVMLIGVFFSGFLGSEGLLYCVFLSNYFINFFVMLVFFVLTYFLFYNAHKIRKVIRVVWYIVLLFVSIIVILFLSIMCVMKIGW